MSKLDHITVNPKILNGQPCIRGMRLTVSRVLEAVAAYPNRDELMTEYPELEAEDIRQALIFAANSLNDRVLDLEEGYETAVA
ncbi:MAG: DUF433 domain-containing protein [Magnetococcus sp. YQC-3]